LHAWTVRFNTSFLSLQRQPSSSIISTVRDDLSQHTYAIESQYLFGCDGARSQVIREFKIPMIKKPGQGLAINVLVKVDLTDYIEHRTGNLHWIFQPEKEYKDYAWSGLARMVMPWTEHA
jgi:2-polyprenyl-6-methoxyphenol hydroxylase-like FAD-dependent oxidoreductase